MPIRRQVFLRNQSLQQSIVPLGDGIFGGWPIRRHLPPTSAIRLPNRGFIAWGSSLDSLPFVDGTSIGYHTQKVLAAVLQRLFAEVDFQSTDHGQFQRGCQGTCREKGQEEKEAICCRTPRIWQWDQHSGESFLEVLPVITRLP
jgi:hypothetical protein